MNRVSEFVEKYREMTCNSDAGSEKGAAVKRTPLHHKEFLPNGLHTELVSSRVTLRNIDIGVRDCR